MSLSDSQSQASSHSFSIEGLLDTALEPAGIEQRDDATAASPDSPDEFDSPDADSADVGPARSTRARRQRLPATTRQSSEEAADRAGTSDCPVDSPRVTEAPATPGVGVRSLQRQLCKKSIRHGYDFKLMVVGESGAGKTTLIDSLFNVESTRNLGSSFVPIKTESTTRLCERFFELEEGGVTVRLTVIDTPGFGAEIDASGCVQPVLDYVDRQLNEFFRHEQGIERSKLHDGRVHALIYLLNPSCRGLKPLDAACMRALQRRVNLVPVIGKADTLTLEEKRQLKTKLVEDLDRYRISVYTLPDFDDWYPQSELGNEDVYLRDQYETLRLSMPLAIIGANSLVRTQAGLWLRAREYPWGVVDIENPEFSDFLKLRELLIMYMEDFKDRTHEVIYEEIRLNRIRQSDRNMMHLSQTLNDRERLLQEKDEQLRRLQEEVESLTRTKSFSMPATSVGHHSQGEQRHHLHSSFRHYHGSRTRSRPEGHG